MIRQSVRGCLIFFLVLLGGGAADAILCSKAFANAQMANPPRMIFWYAVTPGFPPRDEWKKGDTAASLSKEMMYGNMASRPGSREYFVRLRRIGFDGIGLSGFNGPYNPDHVHPTFPDDLPHFSQSRNYLYYIPWARDAGLATFIHVKFFTKGSADNFSWLNDNEWKKVVTYIHFVAKTAKATGCKGISFDFEPYKRYVLKNPWKINAIAKDAFGRALVLSAIKRRAGQIAEAIYAEFPEAEIHLYGIGVGAESLLKRRVPNSAYDFIGDDMGDLIAYFFSGFFTRPFYGGVHIDEACYAVFDEKKIDHCRKMAQMKYIDNILLRWELKEYINKRVTIGMALMVHHRWNSEKWWEKVKNTDEKTLKSTLLRLKKISSYIWVYPGEVDWVYPEIADDLPKSDAMNLDNAPFKSYSQRMKAFNKILKETVNPSLVKP